MGDFSFCTDNLEPNILKMYRPVRVMHQFKKNSVFSDLVHFYNYVPLLVKHVLRDFHKSVVLKKFWNWELILVQVISLHIPIIWNLNFFNSVNPFTRNSGVRQKYVEIGSVKKVIFLNMTQKNVALIFFFCWIISPLS